MEAEHPEHESVEELFLKKEFELLLYRLLHLPGPARAKLQSTFLQRLIDETWTVDTPKGPLSFVVLGRKAAARANSLLTKQPATIEWINSFRPNSVFWDVGANVGVYAMYAALRGDTKVCAFEPAAVNYFLLSANCEANKLGASVECLLLGLGREGSINRMEVSQFEPGRSFRFQSDAQLRPGQSAMIMSIDQLVDDYALPCPNYIKIDAPGSSEAILTGGTRTLERKDVREVHIELKREDSKSGKRIVSLFEQHGFAIVSRDGHGNTNDVTFSKDAA